MDEPLILFPFNYLLLLLLLNILVQWGPGTDESRLRSSAAIGIIVTVGSHLMGFINDDYYIGSLSLTNVVFQLGTAMIIGLIVWVGILVFGKDQQNISKRMILHKKKVLFLIVILYMVFDGFDPYGLGEGEISTRYVNNKIANECLRTLLDENGIDYRTTIFGDSIIWRPESEAQRREFSLKIAMDRACDSES